MSSSSGDVEAPKKETLLYFFFGNVEALITNLNQKLDLNSNVLEKLNLLLFHHVPQPVSPSLNWIPWQQSMINTQSFNVKR